MREQVIVWRDDLVEMFEGMTFNDWRYTSEDCLVKTVAGNYILGKFTTEDKDFHQLGFVSNYGYDVHIGNIKEFAFLE